MSNPPSTNKAVAPFNKPSQLSLLLQASPALHSAQQCFSNPPLGSRPGGTSSGTSRSPASRNNQNAKPRHKKGKRFQVLDEDAEAELFSMQNPHGRRGQQSITHLMQFALPPRPSNQDRFHRHSYNGPRNRQQRYNPAWGLGSGYHAVDKARYIHANYRFVADPRGDYLAHAADADVHLDWNDVLQIIASAQGQAASCPICLGEPVAPRMAKCGHIFCLPCLIRYMHSEDENGPPPERKARWKKCPICYDSVYVSETRPVRWYAGQENEPPREGGDFVLRLVKRKMGSTLAMPRENADTLAPGEDIPWFFAAEVMDYARVMKGSEEYMLQQYDEALAAVEQQEREDELMFGEDTQWTGRAIRMLTEAKEKVRGIGNPPSQPQKPGFAEADLKTRVELDEIGGGVPELNLRKHANVPLRTADSAFIETEGGENHAFLSESSSSVPRTLKETRQRNMESAPPSEYLFYHGLLHYYLSPLDIRILKSAFGSYNNFPSSILPRVERVSHGHVVDADLRKRVKYLSHLPYGCEVAFLECDWKDVVSASVLAEFQGVLERRRQRHEEKDARDEKERIRIEKAEERELAAIRQRRRPSVPNTDGFFNPLVPTAAVLGEPAGSDMETGTSTSPPWPTNADRPGFIPLASPSTSPSMARTVWGTSAVVPTSPGPHATLPLDREIRHSEDDGWLQGWENDLLDQQQQEALTASMDGLHVQVKSGGSGRKGKKSKKITLMSTANGARRGA